ncbi:hypothetical protein AFLA_001809 [Aspergillus flavus NRRL3357]|nr:hypothetical protein AFLA_001809 [Aspergillus flavus NRRL3357]
MNGARTGGGNEKAVVADEASEPQGKASLNDTSSIPDGGIKAWMQVGGTFFVFFNTWQTYYETQQLFSSSSSSISWIGSAQSSLLLVLGLITGPLYDAGYFYHVLFSGSFMILFGQIMLSLSKEWYQVLLSQGFCIGIGTGLVLIPGVAVLSTYFSTKLALANGVAAAGSGLGGILYPIIFHRLFDQIGFAWTCRAIGLVILVTIAIPITVFQLRVKPSCKRKLLDLMAFREPAYTFFVLGGTLEFISLNIPFYYIQYFAITAGVILQNWGFNAVWIFGGGVSIAGGIAMMISRNFQGGWKLLIRQ